MKRLSLLGFHCAFKVCLCCDINTNNLPSSVIYLQCIVLFLLYFDSYLLQFLPFVCRFFPFIPFSLLHPFCLPLYISSLLSPYLPPSSPYVIPPSFPSSFHSYSSIPSSLPFIPTSFSPPSLHPSSLLFSFPSSLSCFLCNLFLPFFLLSLLHPPPSCPSSFPSPIFLTSFFYCFLCLSSLPSFHPPFFPSFRCGHCKKLAPEFEKAASRLKGSVQLAKVTPSSFVVVVVIMKLLF